MPSTTRVLMTNHVTAPAIDRFVEVTIETPPSGTSDLLYLVSRGIDDQNYFYTEIILTMKAWSQESLLINAMMLIN